MNFHSDHDGRRHEVMDTTAVPGVPSASSFVSSISSSSYVVPQLPPSSSSSSSSSASPILLTPAALRASNVDLDDENDSTERATFQVTATSQSHSLLSAAPTRRISTIPEETMLPAPHRPIDTAIHPRSEEKNHQTTTNDPIFDDHDESSTNEYHIPSSYSPPQSSIHTTTSTSVTTLQSTTSSSHASSNLMTNAPSTTTGTTTTPTYLMPSSMNLVPSPTHRPSPTTSRMSSSWEHPTSPSRVARLEVDEHGRNGMGSTGTIYNVPPHESPPEAGPSSVSPNTAFPSRHRQETSGIRPSPSPPSLSHDATVPESAAASSSPVVTTLSTTAETTTSSPTPVVATIKMLISNNIAGSIIGRMGQSISKLQVESQTRIKISQSSDYYPGTQERVCLIQGTSGDNVKHAVGLIIQRCYQIQQSERTQQQSLLAASPMTVYNGGTIVTAPPPLPTTDVGGFDFVIRLLVPVSCCGMIIGKNGSNIKHMEESSGVVSVRLTSKDDIVPQIAYNNNNMANSSTTGGVSHGPGYTTVMVPTNERIVTITSMNVEQCVQCIHIVLDGMMAYPDISQYTNMTTSYVQHNHHHPSHRNQPSSSATYHNHLMLQQPSNLQPRRVYHVPPPQQQQQQVPVAPDPQMYWASSGGGGNSVYHSAPINVPNTSSSPFNDHHPPNQTSASIGMNRRIVSSPNFSMGHHDRSSSKDVNAPMEKSSMSQSTYHNVTHLSSSTFSPSGSFNAIHQPQQQQFYETHEYGSSTPSTYMDSDGLTTGTSPQRSNHYQTQYNANGIYHYHQPSNSQTRNDGLAAPQSTSAPNLLAMQLEQSLVMTPQVPPPQQQQNETSGTMKQSDSSNTQTMGGVTTTATALALQVPTMVAPGCFTAQVLVPDAMIGSILGRGGRTLTDLQLMSNTNIRISQRNEYMPGTRSRIVAIRGPSTQSVWQAQYLLSQRLTSAITATGTNACTAPGQYYHQHHNNATSTVVTTPAGVSNAAPNSATIPVEHQGIVSPRTTTTTASSSSLSSSATTSPGTASGINTANTAYPGAIANNNNHNLTSHVTSDDIPTSANDTTTET